jgi:TIR domain
VSSDEDPIEEVSEQTIASKSLEQPHPRKSELVPSIPQTVRWGPTGGLPPGLSVDNPSEFVPWNVLKSEVELRLLPQIRHIPIGAAVTLEPFHGRANWIVRVRHDDLRINVNVWFGTDGEAGWAWDGLVRVGEVYRENIVAVWQVFRRYSDGTYRRVRELASPLDRKHVFISYVSEDSDLVDRLQAALIKSGVDVWRDRDDIAPGERWRDAIRAAIEDGANFLACFSSNSESKERSYMREELDWAIARLRQQSRDQPWFLPVKLSPCNIPKIPIGHNDDLTAIQHLDLSRNWDHGVARLLRALSRR